LTRSNHHEQKENHHAKKGVLHVIGAADAHAFTFSRESPSQGLGVLFPTLPWPRSGRLVERELRPPLRLVSLGFVPFYVSYLLRLSDGRGRSSYYRRDRFGWTSHRSFLGFARRSSCGSSKDSFSGQKFHARGVAIGKRGGPDSFCLP